MISNLTPGGTIDRYRIERVLGVGGMGTVLLVRHTLLGTHHAMKVLHLPIPSLRERLLSEGRIQAQLLHPNVVRVSDVVPLDPGVALILDFVEGPTLAAFLDRVRPTVEEIDALADQVLDGVSAAHALGVIHRDLKPDNVLLALSRDRAAVVARVADFGLARLLEPDVDAAGGARRTRSGQTLGTPAYMPPEQFRDARSVGPAGDVFSMGAVLYELVTGFQAFEGADPMAIYQQALARDWLPVELRAPGVPARFARAIAAALEPGATDRPQSMAELHALWRADTAPARGVWSSRAIETVGAWVQQVVPPDGVTPTRDCAPLDATTGSTVGVRPVAATLADPPPAGRGLTQAVVFVPDAGPGAQVGPKAVPPPTTGPASHPRLLAGVAAALVLGGAMFAAWWSVVGVPLDGAPDPAASGEAVVAGPPAAAPDPPTPEPSTPTVQTGEASLTGAEATTPEAPGRTATSASVTVTGVGRAQLVSVSGRHYAASAPVPGGTYRLLAWFDADAPTQTLELSLRPGERRTITCTPALRVCR